MPYDLKQRFDTYFGLWEPAYGALKFLLRSLKPGTPPEERGSQPAFANWYKFVGPHFARNEDASVVPALVASCQGVVLELGYATGNQLPRFTLPKITHIYGIEPNACFEPVIAAKIAEVGLEGKYTPVTCGIEEVDVLEEHGIVEGSLDCVLSVQVLCSVKDPKLAARIIYGLLKEGGEMVFWEHGQSHDVITRAAQRIWNLVWPVVIGGCQMTHPIKDILLEAGSWEVIELDTDEEPWSLLPRTWGRLRKVSNV